MKVPDVPDRNNEASHGLQLQTTRDQDHAQLQQRDHLQLMQLQLPQRDHVPPQQLQQRDRDQLQYQQRDREQLHRDKLQQQRDRDREREHLHQLQSINNLLLDLPPPANFQGYPHDKSRTPPKKGNNIDGIKFNNCIIFTCFISSFFYIFIFFLDSICLLMAYECLMDL